MDRRPAGGSKKPRETLWPYFDRGRQAAFHILTLNSQLLTLLLYGCRRRVVKRKLWWDGRAKRKMLRVVKKEEKNRKKVLTKGLGGVNIIKLSRETAPPEGGGQKNLKKVLDKECSMRYNK